MSNSDEISFSIDRLLPLPFSEAVDAVKEAMKANGFGTLTEVDVQATLLEKIGKVVEPYRILGVCNPSLAYQAITAEPTVGVFLPCSVVIRTHEGKVYVHVQDPVLMGSFIPKEGFAELAREARQRLVAALDELTK